MHARYVDAPIQDSSTVVVMTIKRKRAPVYRQTTLNFSARAPTPPTTVSRPDDDDTSIAPLTISTTVLEAAVDDDENDAMNTTDGVEAADEADLMVSTASNADDNSDLMTSTASVDDSAGDARPPSIPRDARPIPIAPGYFASPLGEIFNTKGYEMKATKQSNHLRMLLVVGGKSRAFCIHRLMAFTFYGQPPTTSHIVMHMDRNTLNNVVSNLRWTTRAEQAETACDVRPSSIPSDARPIPIVPGYFASPSGDIFNSKGDKMKPHNNGRELVLSFRVGGKGRSVTVHRIVTFAFHGQPPSPIHTVDHKDGNPLNNEVSNLRWATPKEQAANRFMAKKPSTGPKRPVTFTSTDGKIIEFKSAMEVSVYFGVQGLNSRIIPAIRSGEMYRGGWWRYADTARPSVEYRPIPSASINDKPGYSAGDDGSIMNPHGRVTFGNMTAYGYMKFTATGNFKHCVHTLVAAAFLEKDDLRPLINHINGNRSDNRVQNLERVTHSENTRHAYDTGLIKRAVGKKVVGTRQGVEVVFASIREAARSMGNGSDNGIRLCIKGQAKTSCGYTWALLE